MKYTLDDKEIIEQLVVKSQEGDTNAFEQLYDIFVDPLYRFIYFKTNPTEVDDLLETIFLKVWQKINTYTQDKNNFSAWVFRIAHNTIIDHYRTHKSLFPLDERLQIADEKRDRNPQQKTELTFTQDIIKKALNELKEPYREVVMLKFIQELSNEEIAEITQRTHVSIRVIQHRGLSQLKKILKKHGLTQFNT